MESTQSKNDLGKTAMLPILILAGLIAASFTLFGKEAINGAVQASFFLVTLITIALNISKGLSWKNVESTMIDGAAKSLPSIFTLFCIAGLMGALNMSGTLSTTIYYVAPLLSASSAILVAAIVSAILSRFISSLWLSLPLMTSLWLPISFVLEIENTIMMGAVISGVSFGYLLKLSNKNTHLETKMDSFVWAAFIGSCFIFTWLGINTSAGTEQLPEILSRIKQVFNTNLLSLLPWGLILFLSLRSIPIIPLTFSVMVFTALLALFIQSSFLSQHISGDAEGFGALITTAWTGLYDGIKVNHAVLQEIVLPAGMASILNVLWLILLTHVFIGLLNAVGKQQEDVSSHQPSRKQMVATIFGGAVNLNSDKPAQTPDKLAIFSPLIPWHSLCVLLVIWYPALSFSFITYCVFNLLFLLIFSISLASRKSLSSAKSHEVDTAKG